MWQVPAQTGRLFRMAMVATTFVIAACSSTQSATPTPKDASVGASEGGGGADAGTEVEVPFCDACGAVRTEGSLTNPAIDEASGIVASLTHPGVLYVHNDSGDTARFFATNTKGEDLATYLLSDAGAFDWEDMARGPCPQGTCLYFADFGDNNAVRQSYVIYRVVEPDVITAGEHVVAAESLSFNYPDGSHNAEALLIHPLTGVITITTKVSVGPSAVYEMPMPLSPGKSVTLTRIGEMTPPGQSQRLTGGDVHPLGTGILMRTYSNALFYPMRPDQSVATALLGEPCVLPVADESQGESIGWLADGMSYVTVSEGAGSALYLYACAAVP